MSVRRILPQLAVILMAAGFSVGGGADEAKPPTQADMVMRLLETTRLTNLFTIFATVDAAIEGQ